MCIADKIEIAYYDEIMEAQEGLNPRVDGAFLCLKPEDNRDRNDPYGKTGFMSIQWFYGFLAQYPERIGLIPVAAKI